MEDFKQSSTDSNTEPNSKFLEQLRSKLPEFFTSNDEFDIEKFKGALDNNNVNEIRDGYTLNYVGKSYARLKAGQPTKTVLIPDVKHNTKMENDDSQNIFLTGDNLDVLKHLQNAYTNSVDFIYIDPPYNTGKEDFIYNDKFYLSDDVLQDTLGMSEDEISRLHVIDGRSSHSAWLTFMYPRLKIAQQLLKDTGVIFVSINDNEQANLKLLMDDIFGEGNFVGELIRRNTATAKSSGGIGMIHDYVCVYSKGADNTVKGLLSSGRSLKDEYFNERGYYDLGRLGRASLRYNPNQDYPIKIDDHIFYPGGDKEAYDRRKAGQHAEKDWQWRWTKPMWEIGLMNGFYANSNPKSGVINVKSYEKTKISKDREKYFVETINSKTTNVNSVLKDNEFLNQRGGAEVADLFDGNQVFSYPKPTALIKLLLRLLQNPNMLVLDFFAGSATTADAVMQLNAEDGGNRKYILATLDEPSNSDVAEAAGYSTIDQISRERIKRAGIKIKTDNPLTTGNLDIGFKHFYVKEIEANTIQKLNEFNPDDNGLLASNTVSEFSGDNFTLLDDITKPDTGATGVDTILQTWMIDDGYLFNTPVEKIKLSQNQVHYIEDGAILYVIDNITQDDIHELLNAIGTLELNVKTIIVFGYSLNFSTMTSLKNNVNSVLDGVKVEVRY